MTRPPDLDVLAESEDVHEQCRNRFRKIRDAFEEGQAVHLKHDDEHEGRYVYPDPETEGAYLVAFHTEGRWRRFRHDSFDASLQIWTWATDTADPIPVEETRLWHGAYGLYDMENN